MNQWKWAFISDVHIKESGDESDELLKRFIEACLQDVEIEKVFLLGDIIDLMVGGYGEYIKEYPNFFQSIHRLLDAGKDVYFFEGNHDFHVEGVFEQYKNHPRGKFFFHSEDIIIESRGRRYYIGHGDQIEIENPSYQRYKAFITSPFIAMVLENIVNFKIVDQIGKWASRNSRKRNKQRYDLSNGEDLVRDKFRRSAAQVNAEREVNYIICGHSHVQDNYKVSDNCRYLNNGYAPRAKTYLVVSEEQTQFVPLR